MFEQRPVETGARVGDYDIEIAEGGEGLVDRPSDIIVGGDVAHDDVDAASGPIGGNRPLYRADPAAAPAASPRSPSRTAPRPSPPRSLRTRRSRARPAPATPPSAQQLTFRSASAVARGVRVAPARRDGPRYSGYAIPRSRVPGRRRRSRFGSIACGRAAAAAGQVRRTHRRSVRSRDAAAQRQAAHVRRRERRGVFLVRRQEAQLPVAPGSIRATRSSR